MWYSSTAAEELCGLKCILSKYFFSFNWLLAERKQTDQDQDVAFSYMFNTLLENCWATTSIVFQIAFGQSERQGAIVKHIRPKIGQKREGGEKVVEGKGGDGGRMRRRSWPGDFFYSSFLFIFPNTSQYMVVNKYNWNCYNINAEAWLACISSVIEIGIVNT